jgi:hypothetical protein
MIKRLFAFFVLVALFASCGNDEGKNDSQSDTTEITKPDAGVLSLQEFDKRAAEFVGKEVKIKAVCDHVCRHSGKRLFLVDGDYSIHVDGEERFEESLTGSEIIVKGLVEEDRIDSVSIALTVKHDIESHGGGTKEDKEKIKAVKEWAQLMTDSLKKAGVDHFSTYTLKFISLEK